VPPNDNYLPNASMIISVFQETARNLVSGRNLFRFGELLHENWMCKRSLHEEVSSVAIDQLYDRAMSAGALGGELLGAGHGGFLLLFVPPEKKSRVRQALGNPVELKIGLGAPGCQIIHGQYDAPVRDSTGHFLAVAGA
jgi:D-glycero-alpha-D-manno-heptose-7-phosphate kinase